MKQNVAVCFTQKANSESEFSVYRIFIWEYLWDLHLQKGKGGSGLEQWENLNTLPAQQHQLTPLGALKLSLLGISGQTFIYLL